MPATLLLSDLFFAGEVRAPKRKSQPSGYADTPKQWRTLMLAQPDLVYHHTDTARLPYILRSGMLKPGANRLGGYPDPDFLWATTDPRGDITAAADRSEHYRSGKTRHVRFALPKTLFFPWSEAPSRFSAWTPEHVSGLEAIGTKWGVLPSTWWCRAGSVSVTDCVEIATRSYRDNRWRPLDPKSEIGDATDDQDRGWLMMTVEDLTFASRRYVIPNGPEAYEIRASRRRMAA